MRQSVTIPSQLAVEVRRVAKEKNLTMSRALVTLTERGVAAEAADRAKLIAAYDKFMSENESARKNQADKELIRAIFAKDAIAEDPVRESAATAVGAHPGARGRASHLTR